MLLQPKRLLATNWIIAWLHCNFYLSYNYLYFIIRHHTNVRAGLGIYSNVPPVINQGLQALTRLAGLLQQQQYRPQHQQQQYQSNRGSSEYITNHIHKYFYLGLTKVYIVTIICCTIFYYIIHVLNCSNKAMDINLCKDL